MSAGDEEARLKAERLLKDTSILMKAREQYTQYIDTRFSTKDVTDMLSPYHKQEKFKQPFNKKKLPASEVIRRGYPTVEHNWRGKALENREQEYIDATKAFGAATSEKEKTADVRERELDCAIKIINALNAIEMEQRRLKEAVKKLQKAQKENNGDDIENQLLKIEIHSSSLRSFCSELEKALDEQKKLYDNNFSLKYEKEKTFFDKITENFKKLINSINKKEKADLKGSKSTLLSLQQLHSDRYAAQYKKGQENLDPTSAPPSKPKAT